MILKSFPFLFLFFFLGLADDEVITTLDVDSYDVFLETHPDVVMKYYTPVGVGNMFDHKWCRICKKIEPVYKEVAAETKVGVRFAEIDVSSNPKIGRRLNLKGVPVIKYFKNGKSFEYRGKIDKQELLEFVEGLATAESDQAESLDIERRVKLLEDQIALHNAVIVSYFGEDEKDVTAEVDKAVLSIQDVVRLIIPEKLIAERMHVPFHSLVFYKSGEEAVIYEGSLTHADIKKWVLLELLPLIVPYTAENTPKIFNKEHGVDVQLLYFAPTANPSLSVIEATNVMERIAKKYRYQLIIIQIPAENTRLLDFYGVEKKDLPTAVLTLVKDDQPKKYRLVESISDVSVSSFVDQAMKGDLEPFLRSEKKPIQFVGPVYKVVGSTFDEVVYNPNKNVVVRFFAPWCGKSSDFEPIYEEVAKSYIRDSSIMFTDIDLTKNEVKGFEYRDFPVVLFFKKGREYVMYQGELEKEPFQQFIDENLISFESELLLVC